VVEAALAFPGAILPPVTPQVTLLRIEMLRHHPMRGAAVFDLQLVATPAANGVDRICTFNRTDFEGFPAKMVPDTVFPGDTVFPVTVFPFLRSVCRRWKCRHQLEEGWSGFIFRCVCISSSPLSHRPSHKTWSRTTSESTSEDFA